MGLVAAIYIQCIEILVNEFQKRELEELTIDCLEPQKIDENFNKCKYIQWNMIDGAQIMALVQLVNQFNNQLQFQIESNELLYDFSGSKDCPLSLRIQGYLHYHSYSFMCGSNQTTLDLDNPEHVRIIQLSNYLGQIPQMFTPDFLGYKSHIFGIMNQDPNPLIFYSYPCYNLGKSLELLNITRNPWHQTAFKQWQKHKQFNESMIFAPPFQYPAHQNVYVSLVIPQINELGEYKGLWGIDISGKTLQQLFQNNNETSMMLLVDKDGILIVDGFDQQIIRETQMYFWNTTLTGFNKMDWNTIISADQGDSNCNNNMIIDGYVCRYNTLFQKDIHILSLFDHQYNLYIIILFDMEIIIQEYQQLTYQIREDITDQLYKFTLIMLVSFIAILVILNCMVLKCALEQIVTAISVIQNGLNYELNKVTIGLVREMLEYRLFNSKLGDKLTRLLSKHLTKMLTSQLVKSDECRILDNISYPKHIKPTGLKYLKLITEFCIKLPTSISKSVSQPLLLQTFDIFLTLRRTSMIKRK